MLIILKSAYIYGPLFFFRYKYRFKSNILQPCRLAIVCLFNNFASAKLFLVFVAISRSIQKVFLSLQSKYNCILGEIQFRYPHTL